MGRVEGKVALVTGAARGQGRSHATRLAEEGADIIAIDLCDQLGTVPYALATRDDLEETARLVEQLGRRVVPVVADVRDGAAMSSAVRAGLDALGHLDIVCANAGILSLGPSWELSESSWQDMIDVNLTGVWQTIKAVVPSMIEAGRGGSIVLTASTGAVMGFENHAHYVAAKHGVVGLGRTLANELGRHFIRVNNVQPTSVSTDMLHNQALYDVFFPGQQEPVTIDQFKTVFSTLNVLPVPWIEARDVSEAVLWLASDESRCVTGVSLPVDAGFLQKIGAS